MKELRVDETNIECNANFNNDVESEPTTSSRHAINKLHVNIYIKV